MTKMEAISRFLRSRYFWYSFAALTVFAYLFGLTIPLLGPDEPRYAQVAREMFARGDWVTPTLGGFNWFEKPALLYWLQIGSYQLFGVNEFAARFGSALFGLGTIASLWVLGNRFSAPNRDLAEPNGFGNYVALIAASTLGIIVFSRGASFDIVLTFPVTAACVAFFLYDHYSTNTDRSGTVWLAAFYVSIGFAVLAKGLVGLVFPVATAGLYLLVTMRLPSRRLILSALWGLPLAAAIAAIWYLPMYLTHGWSFIDEFFVQHHFQRFTSNKYKHPQPFYFFLWVLPLMTIPWLPFFFAGVWNGAKRHFFGGEDFDMRFRNVAFSPLFLFCGCWLAVPLVFFSFSGSKLPGYILPAVPPAMVIAAIFVYRWAGERPLRDLLVKGLAVVTLAVVIALLTFVVPRFAEQDSVKSLIEAANAQGHGDARVVGLHTVSHNAEFYASGRLLRNEDGTQKKLLGPLEIAPAIRNTGTGKLLVLVPVEWMHELQALQERSNLRTELIASNEVLSIVLVRE